MGKNMFKTMRESARKAIVESLEDGYEGYLSELHNSTFNVDYEYTDNDEAIEALEESGVFSAIGAIVEYEKDNFGEVYTNFTIPYKVANMLYYIIGEEELADMFDGCEAFDELWNEELTEEECKMLVGWLKDNDRI